MHGNVSHEVDTGSDILAAMTETIKKAPPSALGLRFEISVAVARDLALGSSFHKIPIWVTSNE